jgi:hypothetical protein
MNWLLISNNEQSPKIGFFQEPYGDMIGNNNQGDPGQQ